MCIYDNQPLENCRNNLDNNKNYSNKQEDANQNKGCQDTNTPTTEQNQEQINNNNNNQEIQNQESKTTTTERNHEQTNN